MVQLLEPQLQLKWSELLTLVSFLWLIQVVTISLVCKFTTDLLLLLQQWQHLDAQQHLQVYYFQRHHYHLLR